MESENCRKNAIALSAGDIRRPFNSISVAQPVYLLFNNYEIIENDKVIVWYFIGTLRWIMIYLQISEIKKSIIGSF